MTLRVERGEGDKIRERWSIKRKGVKGRAHKKDNWRIRMRKGRERDQRISIRRE